MCVFLLRPSILSSVPGSVEVQMLLAVIQANEVISEPQQLKLFDLCSPGHWCGAQHIYI